MKRTISLPALVAASVAALVAAGASAQDLPAPPDDGQVAPIATPNAETTVAQPPADPNLAVNELHGDWGVRCFNFDSPAPCDVIQIGTNPDTQQRIMLISIAYLPNEQAYAAQLVVPLGVTLARGLSIDAGASSIPGLRFNRCEQDGCYVEVAIASESIEALAAATEATQLTMFPYQQVEPLQLPFSVNGFATAIARMREEAVERAVPLPQ